MTAKTIYTVGHSTHTLENFLELLQTFDVNCIVDVRSLAASRYNPQFNQQPLSNFLKRHQITYLHFAEEFGARHDAPSVLDTDGRVDFEKVQATMAFKQGVERLEKGLQKGFVIALMCSEAEPFDCHRFGMVAVDLARQGFDIQHIMKDKTLQTQSDLEQELLKKYRKKIPQPNLLEPDITPAQQLAAAYRLRNIDIAYSPHSSEEKEQL